MRFQQLTAPVMAKGLEDTAFYRYYPLASLNEVGGSPDRFGVSVSSFHRRNASYQELWPYSMNSTSTHDTKRSEDLSGRGSTCFLEMPKDWHIAIRRWRRIRIRAGRQRSTASPLRIRMKNTFFIKPW